jgi:hypothetical protein
MLIAMANTDRAAVSHRLRSEWRSWHALPLCQPPSPL